MDNGFKKLELPNKLTPKNWIVKNLIIVLNILFIISIAILSFVVVIFIASSLAAQADTSKNLGGNAYLNILSILLGSLIIWITAKRVEVTRKHWTQDRTRSLVMVTQKNIEEWVNYNYIFDINIFEANQLMSASKGEENILSFNQLAFKPDFYLFGNIRKKQSNKTWIEISLVWQYDKYVLVYKNKGYREVEYKKHSYEERSTSLIF